MNYRVTINQSLNGYNFWIERGGDDDGYGFQFYGTGRIALFQGVRPIARMDYAAFAREHARRNPKSMEILKKHEQNLRG